MCKFFLLMVWDFEDFSKIRYLVVYCVVFVDLVDVFVSESVSEVSVL